MERYKKECKETNQNPKKKEADFKSVLGNLFDIAHADALEMISNEEDRQFLIFQREPGRRGVMGSVDIGLAKKESRKRKRKEQVEKQRRTAADSQHLLQSLAVLEDSTSSSGTEEEDLIVDPSTSTMTISTSKRGLTEVLTANLVASLDRNKVSDRAAVMLIGETARSLGQEIEPLVLNRSSIRLQRQKHRQIIAEQIKDQFDPHFPLIVHWDGKLIPDIAATKSVDRLPVLVTTNGQAQLLAVPKISSGTGEAQAKAIFSVLKDWSLEDKVRGMCCDTTSSNTGRHKGA